MAHKDFPFADRKAWAKDHEAAFKTLTAALASDEPERERSWSMGHQSVPRIISEVGARPKPAEQHSGRGHDGAHEVPDIRLEAVNHVTPQVT